MAVCACGLLMEVCFYANVFKKAFLPSDQQCLLALTLSHESPPTRQDFNGIPHNLRWEYRHFHHIPSQQQCVLARVELFTLQVA